MHRRQLGTVALAVASVGVALALAEAALRTLRPEATAPIEYPCFYEEDERFGFRYVPGATGRVAGHFEIDSTARINSLGFHDDEPLPPARSDWRLLAVGDSFTAGLNLDRSEVWTAVLERRLREGGHPTADVVNLGLDGTGTDVHLDLVRAFAPRFRPHTVIFAFYANDLLDVLHGRFRRECHRGFALSYQDDLQRLVLRKRVDTHLERAFLLAAFEHSYLARASLHAWFGPRNLFRMNFAQASLAELGIDDAVREGRRPRLRAAFDGIAAFAADCDCRVFVVPVPPRRALGGSLRVLRNQLGEIPLEVVDVVPAMERALRERGLAARDLFWVQDNHLNARGNELFAQALAEALSQAAAAPAP